MQYFEQLGCHCFLELNAVAVMRIKDHLEKQSEKMCFRCWLHIPQMCSATCCFLIVT